MDTLLGGAEMKTTTTRTEDKSNQIDPNEKKEWNAPQMKEMGAKDAKNGTEGNPDDGGPGWYNLS